MVYRCSSEKSSINNTLRSKQDRLYTSARQTTLYSDYLFVCKYSIHFSIAFLSGQKSSEEHLQNSKGTLQARNDGRQIF